MSSSDTLISIYDFEIFPYALGDVLTWNVRSAMRCIELGRKKVDIYICVDKQHPAGIYQHHMINAWNYEMFFSELYSSFGTHPLLGNIFIYREREALLDRLNEIIEHDAVNSEAIIDYLTVLEHRQTTSFLGKARNSILKSLKRSKIIKAIYARCLTSSAKAMVNDLRYHDEAKLHEYFIKYIHSHKSINAFAEKNGSIPLLQPAPGSIPDIDEVIIRRFKGKKIVPFHLRMRRLDAGYQGEESYYRDSEFLEWYDFLSKVYRKYPEIEFIALGRLQEKPLELLRLPNVTSLRSFGMGLGHELTLMLKSNFFIGTSSGFAACANFSKIPYVITRMTKGSCQAYDIPYGADRLPFAYDGQLLVYEEESTDMLMECLVKGLNLPEKPDEYKAKNTESLQEEDVDIRNWLAGRVKPEGCNATVFRFEHDDRYRNGETGYLLQPSLKKAYNAIMDKDIPAAELIIRRVENNFPILCMRLKAYKLLKAILDLGDATSLKAKELLADFANYLVISENISNLVSEEVFTKDVINRLNLTINLSPLFESPEGWGAGYAFAAKQGKGVVVGPGSDNRNVFAQPFPTSSYEAYKLVTRASSVKKNKATGRFQINWVDENDNFISTKIESFEVNREEEIFVSFAQAPPRAAKGIIYVTPDGPEDVVRYTEMRILGLNEKNDDQQPHVTL